MDKEDLIIIILNQQGPKSPDYTFTSKQDQEKKFREKKIPDNLYDIQTKRGKRKSRNPTKTSLTLKSVINPRIVRSIAPLLGNKQIILYVVPNDDVPLTEKIILDTLKTEIPSYMIPDMIIPINEFPINAKGKIDYQKLIQSKSNYLGDNTDIHTKIANIWTEVLHLPDGKSLYPHDNFFDLSSSSLDFILLMYKLENAFHVKFSVTILREEKLTIPHLVDIIKSQRVNDCLSTTLLRQLDILQK